MGHDAFGETWELQDLVGDMHQSLFVGCQLCHYRGQLLTAPRGLLVLVLPLSEIVIRDREGVSLDMAYLGTYTKPFIICSVSDHV